MPLPKWLAQLNKRTFNKWELSRGVRPVLIHVGRTSGTTYETPLDAHAIEGGYVFIPNYGPDSDWVRNVLAAEKADVRIEGNTVSLCNPRLVGEDAALSLLPAKAKSLSDKMNLTEFLVMDTA